MRKKIDNSYLLLLFVHKDINRSINPLMQIKISLFSLVQVPLKSEGNFRYI